jgi:hypothetical protein
MTIWRMCIVRWITKATDTRSVYVMLFYFSRQQWLRERSSLLPHEHTAPLFYNFFPSVSHLMTKDQQNHLGFSAAYCCWMYKWCISTAYADAYIGIHSTRWSIHSNQFTAICYILKMGRVILVTVIQYKFYCKVWDSHRNIKITLVNKDFVQWGKMSFWCIFGHWIQKRFQNFSIANIFLSRLKGWNLLLQDTKICIYRGRHEEFKDFFSREDGVVICNDVVQLWKFLAMNITQTSGACSLIRQKWA